MPARDSDDVVAIDFLPHIESMQTDTLLQTDASSASGGLAFDSKKECVLVTSVAAVVTIIIVAALDGFCKGCVSDNWH